MAGARQVNAFLSKKPRRVLVSIRTLAAPDKRYTGYACKLPNCSTTKTILLKYYLLRQELFMLPGFLLCFCLKNIVHPTCHSF